MLNIANNTKMTTKSNTTNTGSVNQTKCAAEQWKKYCNDVGTWSSQHLLDTANR